jgi:hypothetical protein
MMIESNKDAEDIAAQCIKSIEAQIAFLVGLDPDAALPLTKNVKGNSLRAAAALAEDHPTLAADVYEAIRQLEIAQVLHGPKGGRAPQLPAQKEAENKGE